MKECEETYEEWLKRTDEIDKKVREKYKEEYDRKDAAALTHIENMKELIKVTKELTKEIRRENEEKRRKNEK